MIYMQFRPVKNQFQNKLNEDVKKINESEKVFVQADKTRNTYLMTPGAYDKLLQENITKKYKSANKEVIDEIEEEFDALAEKLDISDRIERTPDKPAFVTLKDHKENFHDHPQARLINPKKSELGRVSKQMLDRINNDIRNKTKHNQWTNTFDVIRWFKDLPDKKNLTFIVFDIVDYYPSISNELLETCLNWAKKYTRISEVEMETIMHARRTLLFDNDGKAWAKKEGRKQFDVSMGAYVGAEICELVGLYALSALKNRINTESLGLYRDDGLATLRRSSGSRADRARKDLIKVFHEMGLKITVQTNLKCVDYLDVTLNLNTETYQPYRKPNDNPLYVNRLSNHPLPSSNKYPSRWSHAHHRSHRTRMRSAMQLPPMMRP